MSVDAPPRISTLSSLASDELVAGEPVKYQLRAFPAWESRTVTAEPQARDRASGTRGPAVQPDRSGAENWLVTNPQDG